MALYLCGLDRSGGLKKSVCSVVISSDRDDYRALIMAIVIVLSCVSRLPGAPLGIEHVDNVKV